VAGAAGGDRSGGAGAYGPNDVNTMSKAKKSREELDLEFKGMTPTEAADAYMVKHKDRIEIERAKAKTTGLAPKLPMEQLIEMSRKGDWFDKYFEPAKEGGLPTLSFKNAARLEEEVGSDSLALINFLTYTEQTLGRLRKHLKRAKGKEAAKLRKLITDVEKTREEGLLIGNDGLTIQSKDWFTMQPAFGGSLREQYPDFEEAAKPSVIRMAKGLSQQQLKTQGNRQPTLFDELESDWKTAIVKEGRAAEIQRSGGIIEGIDLEPDESALIDALHVMLHYQSDNTKDPRGENYLAASWQIDGRTAIHYTVTELARIYNGGTKPNGDEVARVQQVADRLAEKRFLMEYSERRPNGKKTIEATERVYAPLFEIRERTIKEGDRQGTRLFIRLHDIFRASIASRYIELPEDIRTRMSKAFGKASYTDYALRNYLLNEVSSRRKEATINRETAYERFCKPEWRPVRKKERLNAALEGCKRLGLLESYEETTGQSGQLKLILKPFTDWSRNPMPLLGDGK
jgi:hypothetical protein